MKYLEYNDNHKLINVETEEEDTVVIDSKEGIIIYIKHNDIGFSIDYYNDFDSPPFRKEQVLWEDVK
jgi:hypothetical protein